MKRILIIAFTMVLTIYAKGQDKVKAYFEHKIDTLYSDGKKDVSQSFKVIVPYQKEFKDVIIEFSILEDDFTPTNVFLPTDCKIKMGTSNDTIKKEFTVKFQRNSKDDRILTLKLNAKKGENNVSLFDSNIIYKIYIKPQVLDSLNSISNNRNYELWFLTGTNFDLFDGIKAQEFFFRTNCIFKIKKDFFGQIAFYKNRYYTIDTSSGSTPFTSIKRPNLGDSLYTMSAGNYRKTVKQTIDPLALQFDVLYKLTNDKESNFFITGGFEFSTITVSINNKYNFLDTSFYLKTSMPDTVKGYNNFGTTAFPETITYKKPNYCLNVGFMWILDDDDVNIKAHLTAGLNNYATLISYYQSKGAGMIYNYESRKDIYCQMRMYATYKPLGLSFGLESFIRQRDVPAFNFTLSKAFTIKGFSKNFTPVSGLKLAN